MSEKVISSDDTTEEHFKWIDEQVDLHILKINRLIRMNSNFRYYPRHDDINIQIRIVNRIIDAGHLAVLKIKIFSQSYIEVDVKYTYKIKEGT